MDQIGLKFFQLTKKKLKKLLNNKIRIKKMEIKTQAVDSNKLIINKHDGLSKYFFNENGSPKIHEKYIQEQKILIEKSEAKKFNKKQLNQNDINDSYCTCFSFLKWFKKCREMCKFLMFYV